MAKTLLNQDRIRIVEEEIDTAVESRNDSLPTLRELGPPDLVHLVKQSVKSGNKQSGVYHHVTGIDASSSASLAAYVNTLIYTPNDKTTKIISGLYCKDINAHQGPQLGSEPEVQVPNNVSNHLTTGLINYIHTTGRYTSGINLFEKLRSRDTEVSSLLARVMLSADEEVQA
ncbi:MAG: hypothetical protein Q9177_004411, partial [Variospora cf. flavescens]